MKENYSTRLEEMLDYYQSRLYYLPLPDVSPVGALLLLVDIDVDDPK